MYAVKSVVEGKRALVPSTRFVPLTIWRQLAVQVRLKVYTCALKTGVGEDEEVRTSPCLP
jgi:hypothetical protein